MNTVLVGTVAQPWSLFIHESPLALRIVRVLISFPISANTLRSETRFRLQS